MRAKIANFEGFLYSSTPYDPEFIAALKDAIPAEQRQWLPDLRLWRVSKVAVAVLDGLLWRFFGGYAAVHPGELGLKPGGQHGRRQPSGKTQHRLPDPYQTLHLQPTAPAELVTACLLYTSDAADE